MKLTIASIALLGGITLATADTLVLTPEEDTEVQTYVTTQKVEPVEAPKDFTVTVGSQVPDTITLHQVEAPKVKHKVSYVVIGKQRVLVDPQTRKIIKVYSD